jgi:MFS transporter, OPA family, glycerol-3-phosphate transporter
MSGTAPRRWFRFWQVLTLLALLLGYTGYYACRVPFPVSAPLVIAESQEELLDLDLTTIGWIGSAGLLAYAFGKLFLGSVIDFVGGRSMFILGMCGSVLATVYFGMGLSVKGFLSAWMLNMLFQSIGWSALLKVVSQWVNYRWYGRVIGLMSLSYLFGDALIRWALSWLMADGYGWRVLYLYSAAALAFITLICALLFRFTPNRFRHETVSVHPLNLFGELGHIRYPQNLFRLLRPYFTSGHFWLIVLLSVSLTIIRETFNNWSIVIIDELTDVSTANAVRYSALFPLAGGFSALAFGFWADWTRPFRRGLWVGIALLILTALLYFLWFNSSRLGIDSYLYVLVLTAFLLIGPYTLLSVWAIEWGASRGAATSTGIMDGIAYAGSVFAGIGIAQLALHWQWPVVLLLLSGCALLGGIVALIYTFTIRPNRRPLHEMPSSSPEPPAQLS